MTQRWQISRWSLKKRHLAPCTAEKPSVSTSSQRQLTLIHCSINPSQLQGSRSRRWSYCGSQVVNNMRVRSKLASPTVTCTCDFDLWWNLQKVVVCWYWYGCQMCVIRIFIFTTYSYSCWNVILLKYNHIYLNENLILNCILNCLISDGFIHQGPKKLQNRLQPCLTWHNIYHLVFLFLFHYCKRDSWVIFVIECYSCGKHE